MSALPEFAPSHVNAWFMARQHLTAPYVTPPDSPATVQPRSSRSWVASLVSEVGWLYAPSDPTPYLAMWARRNNSHGGDLEHAYEQRDLMEVNTLRGAPMLVPREHLSLAMRIAPTPATRSLQRAQELVGITREEIERLQQNIILLLERDPLDARTLRNRLRGGLVRSWGEAARKLGSADSFPDSLEQLVEQGVVFKVKASTRLDTTRLDSTSYFYMVRRDFAPDLNLPPMPEDEAWATLSDLYFHWYSPARFEDFVWWSGTTARKARSVLARFHPPLRALAIGGVPGEYLTTEWAAYAIATFQPPPEPGVAFLPSRDPFLSSFSNLTGRFVSPEFRLRALPRLKGDPVAEPTTVAPIIVQGTVTGVWEWSPEKKAVDYMLFDPVPRWLRARVRALADELTEFIRLEQLTAPPIHLTLPDMTYRIREIAKLTPR